MAKNLHPGFDGVGGGEARSVFGPVAGAYVPAPVGSSTVVDLRDLAGMYVRITCVAEDIFYLFVSDPTDVMVGLTSADFKFDLTALVPDVIGEGFSVREVVPSEFPYLLVRSSTAVPGEVRVRRA